MSKKEITNREKVRQALEKAGRALHLDEIIKKTRLTERQMRSACGADQYEIVRVGPSIFDLMDKVFNGRYFRYTPSEEELELKVLVANDDLDFFLSPDHNYERKVQLIDDQQIVILKRIHPTERVPFFHYRGIASWYNGHRFSLGDDIILHPVDFRQGKFEIYQERKEERNEKEITRKNKILADLVYHVLKYSFRKGERVAFLGRNYIFIGPYGDSIPPEHLEKALKKDRRFVLFRDKSFSFLHRDQRGDLIVGIRKYFYRNEKGQWIYVWIDKEHGERIGRCSECGGIMAWDSKKGWSHAEEDAFPGDYVLGPEFDEA